MTKDEFIKASQELYQSSKDPYLEAKRDRFRRWLRAKAIKNARKRHAKS